MEPAAEFSAFCRLPKILTAPCHGPPADCITASPTKHQLGQRGPTKADEADLPRESAASLLCPIERYGVLLSCDALFVEDKGNSGYYLRCSLEIPGPE